MAKRRPTYNRSLGQRLPRTPHPTVLAAGALTSRKVACSYALSSKSGAYKIHSWPRPRNRKRLLQTVLSKVPHPTHTCAAIPPALPIGSYRLSGVILSDTRNSNNFNRLRMHRPPRSPSASQNRLPCPMPTNPPAEVRNGVYLSIGRLARKTAADIRTT